MWDKLAAGQLHDVRVGVVTSKPVNHSPPTRTLLPVRLLHNHPARIVQIGPSGNTRLIVRTLACPCRVIYRVVNTWP